MKNAVYGCQVYSGSPCPPELARRGIPSVLVGRDPERRARGGGRAGCLRGNVPQASLDEPRRPGGSLLRLRALINCAVRSSPSGEPVGGAAIAAGLPLFRHLGRAALAFSVVFEAVRAAWADAGVTVVPGVMTIAFPAPIAHLAASGSRRQRAFIALDLTRAGQPRRGATCAPAR